MVLLALNLYAGNGDELHAINFGIRCLDDFLIIPAVGASLISGILLGRLENFAFTGCCWVKRKWSLTAVAILFGALCLAPWMHRLSTLSSSLRNAAFGDQLYLKAFHFDVLFGIIQTVALMYLFLISVKKPCTTNGSCKFCREDNSLVPHSTD